MQHRDFVRALGYLIDAYAIFSAALFDALPAQLSAATRLDAVTLAVMRQFGAPLVRWFEHGSQLRGVRVADGTVILDAAPGEQGSVLFLAGVFAEHDRELPDDWRSSAVEVASIRANRLELVG
jgi:hypothetical protein